MSIIVIESDWRETGIKCDCGGMMYSDGKHRPQCCNPKCMEVATDEQCWAQLIIVGRFLKGEERD